MNERVWANNSLGDLTSVLSTISTVADTAGKIGTSAANVYQSFQKPKNVLPGTYNAVAPGQPGQPGYNPYGLPMANQQQPGVQAPGMLSSMSLPVKIGIGVLAAGLLFLAAKKLM